MVIDEADWIEAQRVLLEPGLIVRVKPDAFDIDRLAKTHNGRIGKILEVRDGDVILETVDGKKPHLTGAHYSPWILQMQLDDAARLSSPPESN